MSSAFASWERRPILLWVTGGVGKSTLLARFILDHAEIDGAKRIPYSYLDFDDSEVDPMHLETLLLACV